MAYDRQTTNQQQPPCLVIDLSQPLHCRPFLTKQPVCDPETVWRDRNEPVCLSCVLMAYVLLIIYILLTLCSTSCLGMD